MNPIQQLHQLGQSLWYDNIQRRLLEDGSLAKLIQSGDIRGITSNPSIFHNAIAKSNDYDPALKPMAWADWPAEEIFFQLAIEDIRAAADLFLPLYQETQGADGYVSLEVNPYLAHDTQQTIQQVQQLWEKVNRPNLMIKIPATLAGLPAIRAAIARGINVNVTLIFSLTRYGQVMDAFMAGLEDRLAAGQPIDHVASVASFFVSRLDTKVDGLLQKLIASQDQRAEIAGKLLGKAAIANTCLAYELFKENLKTSERFARLQKKGAHLQRPLWASTSTKNPTYRDVVYVEELIAPDTVNTVPPHTLELFRDHGIASPKLERLVAESRQTLEELEKLGISLAEVTQELEDEGVKAFADAFTALLKTLDERKTAFQVELGPLQKLIPGRLAQLEEAGVSHRLHAHDPYLWTSTTAEHDEIRKRLGWLEAPRTSRALEAELSELVQECQAEGITHALLLGMGGSSLAPEVLAISLSSSGEIPRLSLAILDSTDPAQVRAAARRSAMNRTLYIVSSKSGTTSEVCAFQNYFWARAVRQLKDQAGKHFIAITDPGTELDQQARRLGFRRVIHADPTVGGRFSALTAFGLVPAALLGLSIPRLLDRAQWIADQCTPDQPVGRNPGIVLGAILGEGALRGYNKLSLIADPELTSFGSWLEQLIAESSGKEGRGIIPVDIEPIANPAQYESDRLFVYLQMSKKYSALAQKLQNHGHPVLVLPISNIYDLGAEFYRWEVATAIACAILGVNAFNQPDVQDSKTRTAQKVSQYRQTGAIEEGQPIWNRDPQQGTIYGRAFPGIETARSLKEAIEGFLAQARSGDYVAINAYLPRNARTLAKLQQLRKKIQKLTSKATTLGFGPRFLHSTGQLHKGGADNGLFLQITADPSRDLTIPGEGITFGLLERAQAVGDLEALLARNRRAIRIHLHQARLEDLI